MRVRRSDRRHILISIKCMIFVSILFLDKAYMLLTNFHFEVPFVMHRYFVETYLLVYISYVNRSCRNEKVTGTEIQV